MVARLARTILAVAPVHRVSHVKAVAPHRRASHVKVVVPLRNYLAKSVAVVRFPRCVAFVVVKILDTQLTPQTFRS
jgi:hypothetical protein